MILGAFTVPYLENSVGLATDSLPPLVVITTNEERELPKAFLRRCLVLHMELPKKEDELVEWLLKRGELHHENLDKSIREEAAKQLIVDRKDAIDLGHSPPGQAEYLDILRALANLKANGIDPKEALKNINEFALRKHVEEGEDE